MDGIVCATRGGEASRAVQLAAIEQAKATGECLTFLYIIDADLIHHANELLQTAVRAELTWLGQTLLRLAHKRAQAAGLETTLVIREGKVREAITQFVREMHSGLLFLGAPRDSSADIFGDDEVERFAAAIQEATGIGVEIVLPEGKHVHLAGINEVSGMMEPSHS